LAAAFFLMLLVLLGQRVWTTIKSGGAKWWFKQKQRHGIGH
jgi:hypothetical protein